MELSILKKKKRIFDTVNLIIIILLILTSASAIFLSAWESDQLYGLICAVVSLVFAIIGLVLGKLLPPKEKCIYVSRAAKERLALANLVLNNSLTPSSLMNDSPLYRSWNYVGFLIIGILMLLVNIVGAALCYSVNASFTMIMLYIALGILWIVLIVTCGIWTYYDGCITQAEEYGEAAGPLGKKTLAAMARGTVIFVVIIGIGALGGFIFGKPDTYDIPEVDVDEISRKLAETQERINGLDVEISFAQQEFDSLEDALLGIKQSHNNGKFYYNLQYTADDTLNIISWNDESEDVFIDSYQVSEDGRLSLIRSFISNSITKEAVQGKETGIIE